MAELTLAEKALDIATRAHKGQKRRDGKDYITHPIAVAEKFPVHEEKLRAIGYLHDVLEDCPEWTKERLAEEGMPFDVINACESLRRRKEEDETYFDFIMRLCSSEDHEFIDWELLAMQVKMSDLEHNMFDLQEGATKDKYRFAHEMLTWVYDGARIYS